VTVGMFYDRSGRPISLERLVLLHLAPDYHMVSYTELHGYGVSTDWIGEDLSLGFAAAPLIFETAILHRGAWIDWRRQYATQDQAIRGHVDACNHVRRLVGLPPFAVSDSGLLLVIDIQQRAEPY
jgi:hypothetical protein